MFRVVELAAGETHPIRRAVLRDGTPDDRVEFDGDDDPDTIHLGVQAEDGSVITIGTWIPRRYPDRPGHLAHQLRGMATLPSRRGSGAGDLLLHAGLDRCVAAGSTLVWARARDTAIGFYTERGFEVVGVGYVDLATGLAHHDVVRQLADG